ncbi:hypothetical protein AAFF_G00053220 [Aldrovandia affinis]|uniref:non-specific serine/threonine protein kinase n=1 Tax=Aldrovandia affinis TaxID=143900 RepID=A0AAD7T4T3_9TELE|nr:hypothetical protein AAFF_G00053220 [Aldrovandia affinis]
MPHIETPQEDFKRQDSIKKISPRVEPTNLSSSNRERKRKRKRSAGPICPPHCVDLTHLTCSSTDRKRQCFKNSTSPPLVALTGLSSSSNTERKRSHPLPTEGISNASIPAPQPCPHPSPSLPIPLQLASPTSRSCCWIAVLGQCSATGLQLPPSAETLEGKQHELPMEVALLHIVGRGSPAPKGIVHLLDWYRLPEEVLLVVEHAFDLFDYLLNRGVPLEEDQAKAPPSTLLDIYIEWFTENELHGEPSTMWQLGLIMYEMLHYDRPFHSPGEIVEKRLILQKELSIRTQA